MPDLIKKERAMDCVYEAATTAEMKDNAISNLLYRVRVKIAQEPAVNTLFNQALGALVDTESTIACDFCNIKHCPYNCIPSEDCWYDYLKFREKEYNMESD